jgi:steroid 5-alpha reductase family enzyme
MDKIFGNFIIGKGYCSTGVIEGAAIFNILLGTILYLLCKITKQYSWMDRIWTFLPVMYGIHFVLHPMKCKYIP